MRFFRPIGDLKDLHASERLAVEPCRRAQFCALAGVNVTLAAESAGP